jgi:FkbM family methyltransferase
MPVFTDPIISVIRTIHFRGKARLLNLVGHNSGTRRARIFGSVFELDLDDLIQRQIYFGVAEPHETRLVRNYLRPGMTFVDVGANVGYYTALAASLVTGSGGRVIAFEPSPYAFGRLRSMVLDNGLELVTAIHAGLGEVAGRLNLYLGIGSHNHAPTMIPHENSEATDVRVTTLDEEAERLGIERIDMIKIDVEGYEPKVLAGAQRLLREGRIRAMLCEFNEHWLSRAGSSPQALERAIRDAGFVEPHPAARGAENRFFQLP